MRRIVVLLTIVLAGSLAATPPARGTPGPLRPTPIGVVDAVPARAIVEAIAGGPAGDPTGVSVRGFGRLTLPPGASFELTGPQVLAAAAGLPIATAVVGSATISRLPSPAGDRGDDELAEGRRVRLGLGDWLFVESGRAAVIENDGAADIVVFVAVVGE